MKVWLTRTAELEALRSWAISENLNTDDIEALLSAAAPMLNGLQLTGGGSNHYASTISVPTSLGPVTLHASTGTPGLIDRLMRRYVQI